MAELPAAAAAQLAAQLAALGEEFQRSLPARLRQVEAALTALGKHWEDREVRDRSDEAALRKLCAVAHSLAGAAGTFGHPVLGATALAIEKLARQLDADPAARVESNQRAAGPGHFPSPLGAGASAAASSGSMPLK